MHEPHLDRYRQALNEQFPDLKVAQLEYLSEGWDSVACRVNNNLIFRFPKRAEVEAALRREIALLPELTSCLPLPIPQFTYIADPPGPTFPFVFVGYEELSGVAQEDWPEEARNSTAWRPLFGDFLTALHVFPVERARQLGVRDYCPTGLDEPLASWHETLDEFYGLIQSRVFELLDETTQDRVAASFEEFLEHDRFFQFKPVLVHADLWDDHVLYDLSHNRLSGVIDFGDVAIGDPALDVSAGMLPYYKGRVDETFLERRRFYGWLPPFHSILFGLEHSSPALIEWGLNSLGQILVGFP